ncbi:hypothetical protein D3C79_309920 [compost metagenome]
MRLPADSNLRAFNQRIVNVALHFIHRVLVDQRPLGGAFMAAVTDLQLLNRRHQLVHQTIVDAVLHIDAVGADAGLAAVTELGGHNARHRRVQIGIVENDHRRVAPQLQRQLFNRRCALRHQNAADLGRTGKAQFAHHRAVAQHLAYLRRVAGHHLQHAWRNAGILRQLRQRQRGQRRLFGRFDDHRAARCQRRRNLAGDHRRREVPRRDRRANADRLFHYHQALRGQRRLQHGTVDTLGLFGEPGNKRSGIGDFTARFRQRFTLLGGHQLRQILLGRQHLVGPGQQQHGALFGGQLFPALLRQLRRVNRLLRFFFADQRNACQLSTGRRVDDRFTLAAQRVAPLTVNQALAAQQLGIIQFHCRSLLIGPTRGKECPAPG